MRNDDGRGKKREKGHREKKNWKGHADYVERRRARNAARPKQIFQPNFVPVLTDAGVVQEIRGGTWIRLPL